MIHTTAITALTSTAVSALVPMLQKMVEDGTEEAGKSAVRGLIDKLKQRISHKAPQDALEDLANNPVDTDAQAALRLQLRKIIETDPHFAEFLRQWVAESKTESQSVQSASVTGNSNTTTQIVGSGNVVR